MRESKIENEVVTYAKSLGYLAYKLKGSETGLPDRIFLKNGTAIFIEFKTQKGRLSRRQIKVCESLKAQKILVFVVDTIDDGKKVLNDFK